MLRIKKAEKAPGIINMANRSHAPAILTIDMDNMKNNGMTNNGLTLLLIFLNENAPIIINGNIIGNKKYVFIIFVITRYITRISDNPNVHNRYFFGKL